MLTTTRDMIPPAAIAGSGLRLLLGALLCILSFVASAAEYPAAKEADWIARDFRFHTGEVLPELRLHYATVGDPAGEPVLLDLDGMVTKTGRLADINEAFRPVARTVLTFD